MCVLVQELAKQQGALLSQHGAAACELEEDERKLASVRSELQTNRAGDRKPLTAVNQPIRGQGCFYSHCHQGETVKTHIIGSQHYPSCFDWLVASWPVSAVSK